MIPLGWLICFPPFRLAAPKEPHHGASFVTPGYFACAGRDEHSQLHAGRSTCHLSFPRRFLFTVEQGVQNWQDKQGKDY